MRLRQGAAHPFLLEPALKATLLPEDLHKIKALLQKVGGRKPVFEQIRAWCAKKATTSGDKTIISNKEQQNAFGVSQFGHMFNMDKQLNMAISSQQNNVCRVCYQGPINPESTEASRRNMSLLSILLTSGI
jgi:hypothetical protein